MGENDPAAEGISRQTITVSSGQRPSDLAALQFAVATCIRAQAAFHTNERPTS
jgi:hypothetical protein